MITKTKFISELKISKVLQKAETNLDKAHYENEG